MTGSLQVKKGFYYVVLNLKAGGEWEKSGCQPDYL